MFLYAVVLCDLFYMLYERTANEHDKDNNLD